MKENVSNPVKENLCIKYRQADVYSHFKALAEYSLGRISGYQDSFGSFLRQRNYLYPNL